MPGGVASAVLQSLNGSTTVMSSIFSGSSSPEEAHLLQQAGFQPSLPYHTGAPADEVLPEAGNNAEHEHDSGEHDEHHEEHEDHEHEDHEHEDHEHEEHEDEHHYEEEEEFHEEHEPEQENENEAGGAGGDDQQDAEADGAGAENENEVEVEGAEEEIVEELGEHLSSEVTVLNGLRICFEQANEEINEQTKKIYKRVESVVEVVKGGFGLFSGGKGKAGAGGSKTNNDAEKSTAATTSSTSAGARQYEDGHTSSPSSFGPNRSKTTSKKNKGAENKPSRGSSFVTPKNSSTTRRGKKTSASSLREGSQKEMKQKKTTKIEVQQIKFENINFTKPIPLPIPRLPGSISTSGSPAVPYLPVAPTSNFSTAQPVVKNGGFSVLMKNKNLKMNPNVIDEIIAHPKSCKTDDSDLNSSTTTTLLEQQVNEGSYSDHFGSAPSKRIKAPVNTSGVFSGDEGQYEQDFEFEDAQHDIYEEIVADGVLNLNGTSTAKNTQEAMQEQLKSKKQIRAGAAAPSSPSDQLHLHEQVLVTNLITPELLEELIPIGDELKYRQSLYGGSSSCNQNNQTYANSNGELSPGYCNTIWSVDEANAAAQITQLPPLPFVSKSNTVKQLSPDLQPIGHLVPRGIASTPEVAAILKGDHSAANAKDDSGRIHNSCTELVNHHSVHADANYLFPSSNSSDCGSTKTIILNSPASCTGRDWNNSTVTREELHDDTEIDLYAADSDATPIASLCGKLGNLHYVSPRQEELQVVNGELLQNYNGRDEPPRDVEPPSPEIISSSSNIREINAITTYPSPSAKMKELSRKLFPPAQCDDLFCEQQSSPETVELQRQQNNEGLNEVEEEHDDPETHRPPIVVISPSMTEETDANSDVVADKKNKHPTKLVGHSRRVQPCQQKISLKNPELEQLELQQHAQQHTTPKVVRPRNRSARKINTKEKSKMDRGSKNWQEKTAEEQAASVVVLF
ncbi:unnamed protein product [Amoebophrya sp. A120]|nr:unnamed protein product [Amoebophrya sp. A120]|eukprot:GSA120T00010296001.1